MDWLPPDEPLDTHDNKEHKRDLRFDRHCLQFRMKLKGVVRSDDEGWIDLDDALPESEMDLDQELLERFDIQPGKTYEFRGRAHNIKGWGLWSDPAPTQVPMMLAVCK